MRYLMLNACPRDGNTWRLAGLLRDEIKALCPEAVFDEILLRELSLPYCTGCSLCFRKGGRHCPHDKVLRPVLDAMEQSDGVILATTTFNRMPNALCKNFLDHLCYLLHRPRFFHGKAAVLSTTGGVGAGSTVRYVAGMLRAIGFNRCYTLPYASHSWNDFTPDLKVRGRVKRLAAKFHADVASKKLCAPTYGVLIPYNLFRGMSLSYAPGTPYATEDGVHWTDARRARHAYDPSVPLPLPKRAFGRLFYGIGRLAGRLVTVTYR